MTFNDLCLEICHAPDGIGLHLGLGVLYHVLSVLVIGIGNGKSIFVETVEESFLRIAIVLNGLVIVQMVACQVCK